MARKGKTKKKKKLEDGRKWSLVSDVTETPGEVRTNKNSLDGANSEVTDEKNDLQLSMITVWGNQLMACLASPPVGRTN